MKLSDINSWLLLPQFANNYAFLQRAFDTIIKPCVERIKSLSQPLSLDAIANLTDEELQALYEQYGVAEYYPDLDRDVRNLMFYNMVKFYRWLGTPNALEQLVTYIFNGITLQAKVHDNLAWNNGVLTQPELLDLYDLEIIPSVESLPANATERILANIIRFSRNSQTLRDLWYTMPDNFIDVSACIGLPYGSCAVSNIDNYTICENLQPVIEEHTGYVGQLHNNNYSIQSGFFVKDANNNTILYDENKIYTFVALYMADGQEPDNYTKANCSIIGNPESQGNPKKVYAVIDHTGYQTIGCYCIYTTQPT